jgi:hypothetical protein
MKQLFRRAQFCLVCCIVTSSAFITTLAASSDPDDCLIAALHDRIQERFKEIDRGFGFRRIVTPGETPHRFKPENVRELEAVQRLAQARLRVVLYLAGRGVLVDSPEAPISPGAVWQSIKGPVIVGATAAAAADGRVGNPPRPGDLWREARRAVLAMTENDVYDFSAGRWRFSARPIRATEDSCLTCHRRPGATAPVIGDGAAPLQLGDPLGVVLYGYTNYQQSQGRTCMASNCPP